MEISFYIKSLHLKKKKKKQTNKQTNLELPSPLVDSRDLKSSMQSKQILGILESPYLLSKLTTHHLSKQINFRYSFLSFHEIENIHQTRDNNHIKSFNPKKINKLWYIAYHRNSMSSAFSIT